MSEGDTASVRQVIAVACSGGRDSTALLHTCWRWARAAGAVVHALHVNHGLNASDDAAELHLRAQCKRWSRLWPVHWHRRRLANQPKVGESVEAWGRRERYQALAEMAKLAGSEVVLLAHHREDQAETFLIQAMRGAGPAGLAAMPLQTVRGGVVWMRPWLRVASDGIESYVRRWHLSYTRDASNDDHRFGRNRIRHRVWTKLEEAFPEAASRLGAAAIHAHRASLLIQEVAALDLTAVTEKRALRLIEWRCLTACRRWYCLQAWLREHASSTVSDAFISSLAERLAAPSAAGTWFVSDERSVTVYRNQLVVRRHGGTLAFSDGTGPEAAQIKASTLWSRVQTELPHFGGTLTALRSGKPGIDPQQFERSHLTARRPGDVFAMALNAPARQLKKQFQSAGVPHWKRQGPCLRVVDAQGHEQVIWVAELGVDPNFLVDDGVQLIWRTEQDPEATSAPR